MAPKKVNVLASTDYPLYTIRIIDDHHVLIGGGGGQAKTGVANTIQIFEFENAGNTCTLRQVLRFETGSRPVMNSFLFRNNKVFILAAGMEGDCQLFTIRKKIILAEKQRDDEITTLRAGEHHNEEKELGIRKRRIKLSDKDGFRFTKDKSRDSSPKLIEKRPDRKKSTSSDSGDGGNNHELASDSKIISVFEIKPSLCVQTDFSIDGPFQKCVRFNSDHTVMVTGGADGYLRVWNFKYPDLSAVFEIAAHSNEIDDIDISSIADKVVSASRDGHSFVWNLSDGSKNCELIWNSPNGAHYRFRSCRFGVTEDKRTISKLYTAHIPSIRQHNSLPCYLIKWNTDTFIHEKVVNAGPEIISALAVSDNGIYVGTGTINGSVSIYISFSLQLLYHLTEAHKIFVTGLEFVHSSEQVKALMGGNETSLLSISADNQVQVHHVAPRKMISSWVVLIGFVLFLLASFYILDYIGL